MKQSLRRLGLGLVTILASATMTMAAGAGSSGMGIGAVLGFPTGVSAKIWQGPTNAIDLILGWSLDDNYLSLGGDYVWHNYHLIPVSRGKFPVYYGIGGVVTLAGSPSLGVRGVGGVEYLFPDAPLDLFLEVAPVVIIFKNPDPDLNAGLGMRFFF
jgi:hypothetical protein